MKLWSLGVKNAVATFGASVTNEQIVSLMSFEKVFLWFDNDRAGANATRSVIQGLKGVTDIYLIPPVEQEKGDPADLNSIEEVQNYLDQKKSLLRFELEK
jgi:DNA primase